MPKSVKAVAYIRVSSLEQEKGYSLDAQRQCLVDYAGTYGLEIVRTFAESHSAYSPGRPEFTKMLRFLEEHKEVEAVLAYKLDRLTRNMSDHAILSELRNVRIISATETLPEGASGELLWNMNAAISRFYSAQLAERTALGMITKCKKGMYPSLAPLGYVNIKEDPALAPDPLRADMIRELFELHARTGASLACLVDWAEKRGLTTRRGGKLRSSALHKMLQNPIYYGAFRWAGTEYEGAHEPLISKALFDRCQRRLFEKTHVVTKRSFPYRGLLTCGYCGCKLTAAYAKKKYIYYRCTHGRGPCAQEYIRQDRLGERLASVVDAVHITSELASDLVQLLMDREATQAVHRRNRLSGLENQLERVEHRRETAYSDKADGSIDPERWVRMDRKWAAEEMLIRGEIEDLEESAEPQMDNVKVTLELLNRAPVLYRRQTDSERARFLRVLVWNILITRGSVEPVYRRPFELIAQGAKSANWYPRQDSNL